VGLVNVDGAHNCRAVDLCLLEHVQRLIDDVSEPDRFIQHTVPHLSQRVADEVEMPGDAGIRERLRHGCSRKVLKKPITTFLDHHPKENYFAAACI
jgi:hypothetical protein